MANNRGRAAAKAAKNRQAAERRKTLLHELNRFEGGQYRGGRKSNPNLVKLADDRLMNMHDVVFSKDDKKRLESLANRANRKRKKQLEQINKQPRLVGGKPTGQTKGDVAALAKWNSDNDVIITRKSKSLQRFTSREQFDNYIKYLEKVVDPDYIPAKMEIYKQNFLTAFGKMADGRGDDVIEKVRNMNTTEFMVLVAQHDELQIGHQYGADQRDQKINEVRVALGMPEQESAIEESEYEDDEF